ncbi:MAG: 50S ribosomal protein L6 [Planctomycetota bacterium]
MSRVGKQPVTVPAGVEVRLAGAEIIVKGPKGTAAQALVPEIEVTLQGAPQQVRVRRTSETKRHRALHGLYQRLISNMIQGVTKGYEKQLKVQGTGFRAELQGKNLVLNVGFSNPVTIDCPQGIAIEVPKAASREEMDIFVRGIDKRLVGEIAARIRKVRPCDPYKAKGIRYHDERVRRLEGKTFGATT